MSRATVFIVEDDEEFTQLLKIRLENQGHRVLVSNGADDVLNLLQARLPDLIVLDIFLPDLDGLTILKRLKSPLDIETGRPSRTKDIPVVVITGKAPMIENMTRAEGAADFFVKPIDMEKFVNRICQLLELTQHEREPKS